VVIGGVLSGMAASGGGGNVDIESITAPPQYEAYVYIAVVVAISALIGLAAYALHRNK
jgi:hypothetical protein